VLARYGPETSEIRKKLQSTTKARIDLVWPESADETVNLEPVRMQSGTSVQSLAHDIQSLKPTETSKIALQTRALDLSDGLQKTIWLITSSSENNVPAPFTATLIFWLLAIFFIFGLLSPRNKTVIAVLFVCSLSIGSAIFLILDMDAPYHGMMKVSADPLRFAITHINR